MISCRPISDLSYVRCHTAAYYRSGWDLRIFIELHVHPHLRDTHGHDVSSVEPLKSYPVRPVLRDASMSSCFPFERRPFWSMGLIQLYTWMIWIAHSMTGDLSSSGSSDLSHIVFDSSYVSDTRDWFESVLIVMDQKLWYDPTLGHSHLREFFSIGWPLCWGILFSVDDGFLSHVHSSEDIRCPFSHWSMRHDWRISSGVLYTGAYPFRSMMVFYGIVVP